VWASGLSAYYFSWRFIPSVGQIICGLSSRGLWQETRPDVYGGIVVSIVDEFAVPAVEDALCEALGLAGTAAMTCSTGPEFTWCLGWYAGRTDPESVLMRRA